MPRRSTTFFAAAALLLGALLTAQDHREDGTPVAARFHLGVDAAFLTGLTQQGYRIVDLEVQSLSPRRYSAALVSNTGPYARTWWWLTQATPSQLGSFLRQNNARLIDLEPFVDNGQVYFAAVMVANSGAHQKAWWWYYNTTSSNLANRAAANGARIVDVESYDLGPVTLHAGVMIRNAGVDQRSWSFLTGATSSAIAAALSRGGLRLYDLEPSASGNWDAVLTSNPTNTKWWYYLNLTGQEVAHVARQIGARVVDIEPRVLPFVGTRYDVVLTNNSNALSTRLSALLRSTTDGVRGVYLKKVGGPVLADIMSDEPMDPASVLKTLHLVRAMRFVSQGLLNLNASVPVWDGCGPTCCPQRTGPANETLTIALQKMMRQSDNQRTLSVADLVGGLAGLNATAQGIGATATTMNHDIGCGLPANVTTLADLARMHEAVRSGYVGSYRDDFYAIMGRWNGGGYLDTILSEEATAVGLTSSQLSAFRARIEWRSKGGSYTLSGPREHRGTAAWVTLPFYGNGGIQDREYVSGVFVNDSTNPSVGTPMSIVHMEAYREEIRAAMRSWANHVFGSLQPYGTACAGTVGTPAHTAFGTPEIGQTVRYSLVGARGGAASTMLIGLSDRFWGRTTLPLDLGFLGAPGCFLRTDPVDSLPRVVGRTGSARADVALPLDHALIRGEFFTQFLIVDPGANPLGLVTTNGMHTTIGGQSRR